MVRTIAGGRTDERSTAQSWVQWRRVVRRVGRYAGLALFLGFSLAPFLWMVSTALKSDVAVRSLPLQLVPEQVSFEGFERSVRQHDLGTLFRNSLIVSSSTALITGTVGTLAGYGLSRLRLKHATAVIHALLVSQMVPTVLLVLPYFILMRWAGLLDTLIALTLAYSAFTLPIVTWMLRGFFDRVPRDLDEAAWVDGCSQIRALRYVVLPVARPGIAAAVIFAFLVAWQEYLFALALTTSSDMRVITVGLASLIGQFGILWNDLMALGLLAILPLCVLFILVERHLVEGLAGGVKG